MNEILQLLDQKKLKVFGHAESLEEARDIAITMLEDSQRPTVITALELYHNTLLNQLSQDIRKLL